MNTGIGAIMQLFSLFSMGTSTVSQVQAMRQMNHQPAQVQPVCPANTTPGTVTYPDGHQGVVCYEHNVRH